MCVSHIQQYGMQIINGSVAFGSLQVAALFSDVTYSNYTKYALGKTLKCIRQFLLIQLLASGGFCRLNITGEKRQKSTHTVG